MGLEKSSPLPNPYPQYPPNKNPFSQNCNTDSILKDILFDVEVKQPGISAFYLQSSFPKEWKIEITQNVKEIATKVPPGSSIQKPFQIHEIHGLQPPEPIVVQIEASPTDTQRLVDGHIYGLQYFDPLKNVWVYENQEVFVEFPSGRFVKFPLFHFSVYRCIEINMGQEISSLRNKVFDMSYDKSRINDGYKRAGRLYYLPAGFIGTAIKCNMRGGFPEDWNVCFHGCSPMAAIGIIKNGFKIPTKNRPDRLPIDMTVKIPGREKKISDEQHSFLHLSDIRAFMQNMKLQKTNQYAEMIKKKQKNAKSENDGLLQVS